MRIIQKNIGTLKEIVLAANGGAEGTANIVNKTTDVVEMTNNTTKQILLMKAWTNFEVLQLNLSCRKINM